ncbi:hypothetical protein [Staphylothermus hellenicus]|uniref:Uncharacterized protein n=1 Tax=Staphylothermus hellenicus (strain DSM 12710 / JCM 10830 / BK20S6-10-b1 / P8) TaxID=591019 RepID=D7DC86_STAHD|nr:hypothetical protein [Staphylothermus hellenicus]ADI31783.1 hypothetical protein Shell_0660 [Staphylothermus hellenicus DSM 12710]
MIETNEVEEEWYVVKGLKPPIYVGLTRNSRKRIISILYILLALLIIFIFIAESSGLFIQGLSMILLFLLILGQGLLSFLPTRGKVLSLSDQKYIRGLLESIKDYVSKWSIPSNNIPVVAILSNGIYMYIYYSTGAKLLITFVKPTMYLKIVQGKPTVKTKFIKQYNGKTWRNKGLIIGVIDAVFPHPEIRGMNIHIRGNAIKLSTPIEHGQIREIVSNFNKIVRGRGDIL